MVAKTSPMEFRLKPLELIIIVLSLLLSGLGLGQAIERDFQVGIDNLSVTLGPLFVALTLIVRKRTKIVSKSAP